MVQQIAKSLFIFVIIIKIFSAQQSYKTPDFAPYCPPLHADGDYLIKPPNSTIPPFVVHCEYGQYGTENGSIVITRLFKGNLQEHHPNCSDVHYGFGTQQTGYYMGLEKMHQITQSGHFALTLVVKALDDDFEGAVRYGSFSVGSEEERYVQKWGEYLENDGDDGGISDNWNGLTYNPKLKSCFDNQFQTDANSTAGWGEFRMIIRRVN